MSGRTGGLVAILLFAVGGWQVPGRAVTPALTHLPGDLGDSRFNNYVLEHGYRWACGEPLHRRFWHPPFHHPARWVAGFSDTHLGTLPVYAAFRHAGADPEHAFQLWYLLFTGLNFWAGWWAARRLGGGPLAAGVAAYLFAFGLPAVAQLTHVQLTPRGLVPVALVYGWRTITRPGWRPLAATAACVAGQLYATVYVAFFLVELLLLMALFAGWRAWRELLWPAGGEKWKRLAVLAAAGAAVAPLVYGHVRAAGEYLPLPHDVKMAILPDAAAWVRPTGASDTWGGFTDVGTPCDFVWEKMLFPGAVGWLGVAVGVAAAVRRPAADGWRFAAAAVVGCVVMAALVTRVAGVSAYDPILYLPGVSGVRAVGRMVLVLAWPLGFAAGLFLDAAIARLPRRAAVLAAAAALGGLVFDQATVPPDHPEWDRTHFPIADAQNRRERLAAALRAEPGMTAFYVFPPPGVDNMGQVLGQLDAMWAGMMIDVPTLNGWTGYWPTGWNFFLTVGDLLYWLKEYTPAYHDEFLRGLRVFGALPPAASEFEARWRDAYHRPGAVDPPPAR